MTALTLLMPGTPMLFQGQEFASSRPFYYFADHEPALAKLVYRGRNEFLRQFPSLARPEMQAILPDPAARATFEASKLDWREREANAGTVALHRDLLALRQAHRAMHAPGDGDFDGAVLAEAAFVLRYFGTTLADDRLLIVNLGRDTLLSPAPEPLLAPPDGMGWEIAWSSEAPEYGGCGTPRVEDARGWHLQGEAAVVLRPVTEPTGEFVL
jgi:maltooligosyltrehalose trehalohydrolase